ncbi:MULTISPECIES: DNA-processing protein DprA [Bacteria]|uniref:DNA-processing protein DprA n=1 Tax=Bacteria TaxID=2 RepID=UPI003C7CE628
MSDAAGVTPDAAEIRPPQGQANADDVLADETLLRAAGALRPDREGQETIARVAWNIVCEPGDGVAGALVSALGPVEALRVMCAGDRAFAADAENDAARPAFGELREGRRRWTARLDRGKIHGALRTAVQCGARLLLPDDEEWPEMLADLGPHSPLALWARGQGVALARTGVAIVGARAASSYGEHVASVLAGELAAQGVVVISGGAYGIDGSAHRAALGADGTTVAVLAGGVDRAYPSGHSQLFARIAETGAVVSELPCGSTPTRWRFLARNRVIGALAAATVVVEAGWRSGSLNTAGHAATLGRPLGAVPGSVLSSMSAGCHRLLREYDARCVTSAADVCELIGERALASASTDHADADLALLRDALSRRAACSVEELARRSGLSRRRIETLLGMLSLEGQVTREEGGWRDRGAVRGPRTQQPDTGRDD